jgi:2-polyprenyl-6-methoxyphenol hydroxylase-like FAD-dependent oxidoreductase
MTQTFDAIVVGARCAGAPTAMLLAQRGHRVLLADKATFPSDTVSTHMIHAPGVAALRRWGLLDAVVATGCPPIETYSFDFGPITLRGTSRPVDGSAVAYAPRRTVLDAILVDAARDAGVEVREGYSVDEILTDGDSVVGIRGHGRDGVTVDDHARVVIGADGRSSKVARAVGAQEYNAKPMLQQSFYTYYRGLPADGMEIYVRPERGWAAIPTNDDLTLVVLGWAAAEAAAYKTDPEGNFLRTLDLVPEFAARVHAAERVARFTAGSVSSFFRVSHGPGWALVGDAGYTKDPITAQGMSDAFYDAERCAVALDAVLSGARSFDDAMTERENARDSHALPIYEFTCQLATLEPPPPELQQLLGAIVGNQPAIDDFVSITAGTVSPAEFFAPEHIGELMGAAAI